MLAYTCFKKFLDKREERFEVNKVEIGKRRWLGSTSEALTLCYPHSSSVELEKLLTENGCFILDETLLEDGKNISNRMYFKTLDEMQNTIRFLTENKKISPELSEEVLKYLAKIKVIDNQIKAFIGGGSIEISMGPRSMVPKFY